MYIVSILLLLLSCGKKAEDTQKPDSGAQTTETDAQRTNALRTQKVERLFNAISGRAETVLNVELDNFKNLNILFTEDKNKEYYGETPLTYAVRVGDIKIIKLLFKVEVNLNEKNLDQETALLLAAKESRAEILSLLIKKGSDLEVKDKRGNTPLIIAIIKQDQAAAIELLQNNASYRAQGDQNISAYALAASFQMSAVYRLIAKIANFGKEINDELIISTIEKSDTIFLKYLGFNQKEFEKKIIDLNLIPLVLDHVRSEKAKEILSYLYSYDIPKEEKNVSFHALNSIIINNTDALEYFLTNKEVDINQQGNFGIPLIGHAIKNLSYRTVESLYEMNANLWYMPNKEERIRVHVCSLVPKKYEASRISDGEDHREKIRMLLKCN